MRLDDVLRLVAALEAWERRPGERARAVDMENACAAVAHQLGISTSLLRERIAAARRAGLEPKAAVGRVIS